MKPALQTNLVPQIITLLGAEFDCKFAPYFRMAEAIIELAKIKGECLPQDLLTCGFSKAEIDDRWHMSNAMANVELRLIKNRSFKIGGFYEEYLDDCRA